MTAGRDTDREVRDDVKRVGLRFPMSFELSHDGFGQAGSGALVQRAPLRLDPRKRCRVKPLSLGGIARAERFSDLGLAEAAAGIIRDAPAEPENASSGMLGRTGHRQGMRSTPVQKRPAQALESRGSIEIAGVLGGFGRKFERDARSATARPAARPPHRSRQRSEPA